MRKLALYTTIATLGAITGWALGYLHIPQVQRDYLFFLGFVAACSSIALVQLFVFSKGSKKKYGAKRTTPFLGRPVLAGTVAIGAALCGWYVFGQYSALRTQITLQNQQLSDIRAIVAQAQHSSQVPLLNDLLESVAQALKDNPTRTLSDALIVRIAETSAAFKPMRYMEQDTLSAQAISPERGQLLQALVLMNLDTASFGKIIRTTTFASADLRKANLKGLDLRGINLQTANLRNADLFMTNLRSANLSQANLWATTLDSANLSKANLERANLEWAKLNRANLDSAFMKGANCLNAQFLATRAIKANCDWIKADGAFFIEVNMTNASFQGAILSNTNFKAANLEKADLRHVRLWGAKMDGAWANNAWVDRSWPDSLKQWPIHGLETFLERHYLSRDSTDKSGAVVYLLKKK
jgi:uncharacterized protein YjbI with pentapeptide repeats